METVWSYEYSKELGFHLYIPNGGKLVLGFEKPKFVLGSGNTLSAIKHEDSIVNKASIEIENYMNSMYPVVKVLDEVGYENYGRILSSVANRIYHEMEVRLCSNIKLFAK